MRFAARRFSCTLEQESLVIDSGVNHDQVAKSSQPALHAEVQVEGAILALAKLGPGRRPLPITPENKEMWWWQGLRGLANVALGWVSFRTASLQDTVE